MPSSPIRALVDRPAGFEPEAVQSVQSCADGLGLGARSVPTWDHYLLTVKGNQPGLYHQLACLP